MPGARASEPTPWAYVLRGGQAAAHFFVNQRRPLREYVEDWTAPHELSHLLLPYVTSNDAWLSEGLATYYQNVSRVRSGAITPQDAWQRMHSGFRRGKDGTTGKLTLKQATERMYRDGGYMRVYWSGAAILMMADVRLRQLTDNKQSLDTVLAKFGECCLDPDPEWTARRVFEKFDEIAGASVFVPLHDTHVTSTEFPDLSKTYDEIGLQGLGGKLEMKSSAPSMAIRDAIMAPGPYRTPPELLN
jgi:predicted metalloprotease with PDZ domain